MATRASSRSQSWEHQQNQALLFLAGVLVVCAGLATLVPWVCAMLVGWVHSGQLPRLGMQEAMQTALSREFWSGDPAAAYPRDVQRLLPGGWGFWTTAALMLTLLVASVAAAAREIEARMGQAVADRRWYHLFLGRRPQSFGRYRSVKALVVDAPRADRVIVGTIGKPPALLAVAGDVQIAVIAAPRSGKTSGCVVPAVLEHDGPVLTTSVRTDVVKATRSRRERMGETFVWDPFGDDSHSWDPLQGCEAWSHALLVSRWLGHAVQLGQTASAEYFDEAAQELAAPLLHAAALTDDQTIVDVYRWVRARDIKTPTEILVAAGADDAAARLKSVYALNDRQRDGILGTVQVQLKAYGHPAAARTAPRGRGIRPERLFDGTANTIYLIAGREHQRLLAPLVVTMVSSLLFYAAEQENRSGGSIQPQALFALDETAQIAPLQELSQILSVSLPSVRFMTIWHSVAQMRERYGADAAATILALSQAKVFLGSITDDFTRQELVHLLGQRPEEHDGHTQYRDALTAQALQRLRSGQGLLIHGELPPVFFTQRRYFEDRALQRLRAA
jgi:type IV secretion system protein VirD4